MPVRVKTLPISRDFAHHFHLGLIFDIIHLFSVGRYAII